MRRLLLLISITVFALNFSANNLINGNWKVYSAFNAPAQKIIDTGKKVYYLSGGNLFSYDLKEDEGISYTIGNYLNDNDISDIYYDYDKSLLAIAYTSGNIDLLYSDGRIKNLPEIANASISSSKKINDVAFYDDLMLVATDFGLVIYDLNKCEVRRSGRYDKAVTSLTVMAGHIVIGLDSKLWSIPLDGTINKLENFKEICSWTLPVEMCAVSDTKLIVRRDDDKRYLLSLLDIDVENARLIRYVALNDDLLYDKASYIIKGSNGNVFCVMGDRLFSIDAEGGAKLMYALPPILTDNVIGTYDGRKLWGLDSDGLMGIDKDGEDYSVICSRFRPEQLATHKVAFIIPANGADRVYLTNLGLTAYRNNGSSTEGLDICQATTLVSDGMMIDVTSRDARARIPWVTERQAKYGNYPFSPTRLAEDSDDSDTYFLGTGNDGLYKISSGVLVGRYDEDNAPMAQPWGWRVHEVSIDRAGNLWVGADAPEGKSGIMVLPSEKRKLDPSEVKRTDWIEIDIPEYKSNKDIRILHCKKSDMVFIIDCNVSSSLVAYDTNGTLSDFGDDRSLVWTTFVDHDGKSFRATRNTALCEDSEGKVWIGTTSGIFEIRRAENALDASMRINRIKVPRTDGSGLADYLAGDDVVMDISVDNAGRKWIATQNSGIYVTNSSGNEILANFTSSNSPLKSNYVNAVYANPYGSSVLIGTDSGLFEFLNSASPAKNDYSNVYSYPNPAKSTDMITITGLMSESLVKITDVAGNLVWQGKSEGGDVKWDGCNFGGKHVSSGVYYVFISKVDGSGTSKGAVAKILIVN